MRRQGYTNASAGYPRVAPGHLLEDLPVAVGAEDRSGYAVIELGFLRDENRPPPTRWRDRMLPRLRGRARLVATALALVFAATVPGGAAQGRSDFGRPVDIRVDGLVQFRIFDGVAYLAEQSDSLSAYRLSDGAQRWRRTVPGVQPFGMVVTGGTLVVFTADTGSAVVGLDAADGHERWRHPGMPVLLDPERGAVVLENGQVGDDGRSVDGGSLSGVDLVDGHTLWSHPVRRGGLFRTSASVVTPVPVVGPAAAGAAGPGGGPGAGLPPVRGSGRRPAGTVAAGERPADRFAPAFTSSSAVVITPVRGAPSLLDPTDGTTTALPLAARGADQVVVLPDMIVIGGVSRGTPIVTALDRGTFRQRWQIRALPLVDAQPCGTLVCLSGPLDTIAVDPATGITRNTFPWLLGRASAGADIGYRLIEADDFNGDASLIQGVAVLRPGDGSEVLALPDWRPLAPLDTGARRIPMQAGTFASTRRLAVLDLDAMTAIPIAEYPGESAGCRSDPRYLACQVWIDRVRAWRYAS